MTPAVSELADRAEISSLVSRYFSAIDDKRLGERAWRRCSPPAAA
jgi:hypothetical protein